MADRGTFPIVGVKSDLHLLTAILTGAGAADMVNAEATNMGGGEVESATRTGTGAFTLALRKRYPALKSVVGCCVVGTNGTGTAGLKARVVDYDAQNQEVKILCEVNTTATDPSANDEVHLTLLMRNSSRNE